MPPPAVNPFIHRLELRWYDYLQVLFMTVTLIAPVRLLCMILVAFLVYILTISRHLIIKIFGFHYGRSIIRVTLLSLVRLFLFFASFVWLKVKGTRAKSTKAPILVIAPHSTFMDCTVFYACGCPSPVSRIENGQIPLIGHCIEVLDPIYVDRSVKDSRDKTLADIKARAEYYFTRGYGQDDDLPDSGFWGQVVIFPEGTCSNRKALLPFKRGGFHPGLPIQPVIVRYINRKDTVTWTWDGNSGPVQMWLTLCQFYTNCEFEYLPVYNPSKEERANDVLYANNVRDIMAKALGVPTSNRAYSFNQKKDVDESELTENASAFNNFHPLEDGICCLANGDDKSENPLKVDDHDVSTPATAHSYNLRRRTPHHKNDEHDEILVNSIGDESLNISSSITATKAMKSPERVTKVDTDMNEDDPSMVSSVIGKGRSFDTSNNIEYKTRPNENYGNTASPVVISSTASA